jgi:hypothetical protein
MCSRLPTSPRKSAHSSVPDSTSDQLHTHREVPLQLSDGVARDDSLAELANRKALRHRRSC